MHANDNTRGVDESFERHFVFCTDDLQVVLLAQIAITSYTRASYLAFKKVLLLRECIQTVAKNDETVDEAQIWKRIKEAGVATKRLFSEGDKYLQIAQLLLTKQAISGMSRDPQLDIATDTKYYTPYVALYRQIRNNNNGASSISKLGVLSLWRQYRLASSTMPYTRSEKLRRIIHSQTSLIDVLTSYDRRADLYCTVLDQLVSTITHKPQIRLWQAARTLLRAQNIGTKILSVLTAFQTSLQCYEVVHGKIIPDCAPKLWRELRLVNATRVTIQATQRELAILADRPSQDTMTIQDRAKLTWFAEALRDTLRQQWRDLA